LDTEYALAKGHFKEPASLTTLITRPCPARTIAGRVSREAIRAPQVDLHGLPPGQFVDLPGGSVRAGYRGIVDQHVHVTVGLAGRVQHGTDAVGIGDVRHGDPDARPTVGERRLRSGESFGVPP
jgi:hypothetical protein